MATQLVCWKCGASLKDVPRPITRRSNCPACYAELHCCRMCRKQDNRYIGRCSDERADPPRDKDKANFCDYFAPLSGAFDSGRSRAAADARSELEALFGDAPNAEGDAAGADSAADDDPTERARAELERLFGGGERDT